MQGVLDVDVKLKKELIKPKLDLKYNFLANTNSGNYFNTNNYKWGLNMAFPLFLRTPRNEYKISKLYAKNNALELSNKRNELDMKFQLVQQNLLIVEEQIKNAELNAKFSLRLLEAEKLKFEQGESSLFLLNTRETRWMDAELKLAEYRTKFIKGVFELRYLCGNLE
jgi:outer membrane protein TolC